MDVQSAAHTVSDAGVATWGAAFRGVGAVSDKLKRDRKGKSKNFRGVRGKQQDVKKAIVRLAEGQTIDVTTRI